MKIAYRRFVAALFLSLMVLPFMASYSFAADYDSSSSNEELTKEVVGPAEDFSLDGLSADQVAELVIAYEPVWAIGTGLTPTAKDVEEVHAFIRKALVERLGADGAGVRILYGGSVKPSNAAELMNVANVNGALVGGASLKCADFMGIAGVYK